MQLLALTALAALSLPVTQTSSQLPNMGGASISTTPPAAETFGLATGQWIDPSTTKLGRMRGDLYSSEGAPKYELNAVVYEAIAGSAEETNRFGGVVGALYGAGGFQVNVAGTWDLNANETRGHFDADIYTMGPTPLAPILVLGKLSGRLGYPAPTEPIVVGGFEGEEPILVGALRTERNFRGRWELAN